MRATLVPFLALLVTLLLAASSAVRAESLENVVMPGKVITGHADLESECKKCHMRFNKSAQTGLCLDCHKEVNVDVMQKQGYHGRLSERECRTCHTDHKGREMNISPVDPRSFDHMLTDFALRGGHASAKVECRDCHAPTKKYREAPTACNSCHKKDDKHKGSLGTACADCHVDRNWKDVKFDHTDTKFRLLGKHIDVECKECHSDPKFKGAPSECNACHKKDDKHKGSYGVKCASCHTEKDWNSIVLDHDRDTKYRLRGKHVTTKCDSCHKGVYAKDKLKTSCLSCHEKDDKHEGQEGKQCESCHNERKWTDTRYDHGLARFPLLGKHTRTECKECHRTPAFKDAETDCAACHQKADTHKRRLGPKCESCHNARDWKHWIYDHDRRTRFKLDGGHKGISCEACHKRPVDRTPTLSGTCASCHEDDDVHDTSFGKQCERCHLTSSWKKLMRGVSGAR